MATISLVANHTDNATNDAWESAPTAGNLLICIGANRVGTSTSGATCTDDGSGAAWTKFVAYDDNTDPTWRRSVSAWYKIAQAGDSGATVTVGSYGCQAIQLLEFSSSDAGAWSMVSSPSLVGPSDNGTNSSGLGAQSGNFSLGTTSSVNTGTNLVLGCIAAKEYSGTDNYQTSASGAFSSLGLTWIQWNSTAALSQMMLETAWLQSDTSGTKTSTVTGTVSCTDSGENTGVTGWIVVFNAASASTAKNLLLQRMMRQ